MKKPLTLTLAPMMLLTVFALPAAAATAEDSCDHAHADGVEPRHPGAECIFCDGLAKKVGETNHGDLFECQKCGKTFEW